MPRPYADESDYRAMLDLLSRNFTAVDGPVLCTSCEFEWWRFQEQDPDGEIAGAWLWEDGGELVGFAWPFGAELDMFCLPRRPELEPMVEWAEQHSRSTGQTALEIAATEGSPLAELLLRRGYETTAKQIDWRLRASLEEIPERPPAEGFRVRALRDDEQAQRASLAQHELRAHLSRAPTYRPELNLTVEAPDGGLAAFAVGWIDEANRLGVLEPLECREQYRRRGLGSAMIAEMLRRMRDAGATRASICNFSDNTPAAGLYESLGFERRGTNRGYGASLDQGKA